MILLAPNKILQRDFNSDFERDFDDLVWGRRAGHMGHHEYENASMALWTDFIDTHGDQYYISDTEIALIEHAAEVSARLLGSQPITLVSRGCGTKFLAKEGQLLKHFENVAGIVYLDRSEAALEQSVEEGRTLLPNAWHKTIKANIYDPGLRYPVEGVEVGTSFGLTFMNIEGFPSSPPPKSAYVQNLSAINRQMRKDSHFIVTLDHNQDRKSVENAYAGQGEFAKDMLYRTGAINPDSVDFVVKFHRASQTLAHGFRFRHDEAVASRSGVRNIKEGAVLWFNNSVKPAVDDASDWNRSSSFSYARSDISSDLQGRIGWHHLIK